MAIIETTGQELTAELLDLMQDEKIIEQGLATFLDVGWALARIRDGKKYRQLGHATFEAYVTERWNMSRERARQLMNAAEVAGLMPTDVGIPEPTNEAQLRPLAPLAKANPDAARQVWADAVETAGGGQPTAAQVQAAVDAHQAPVDDLDDDLDDSMVCLECGVDLDHGDHLQWCSDAGDVANENYDAADASHQEQAEPASDDPEPASEPAKPVATATPRPAPPQKAHPATFSTAILDRIADLLTEFGIPNDALVVDPFAGTGRIHDLRTRITGLRTIGVELEPEWAGMHPDTICADARTIGDIGDHVDAVVTSPAYGNRMADTYTDGSVRQTYTACLGHDLTDGNSGALQWGEEYRRLHQDVWDACASLLDVDGLFVLNCKNHIRAGRIQRVVEWHVDYLVSIGFALEAWDIVPTRGLMAGENHDARVDHEAVVVLRKVVVS